MSDFDTRQLIQVKVTCRRSKRFSIQIFRHMHKTHSSGRRPSSYLRAQFDLASMATGLPRSCQEELHEYGIKPQAHLVALSSVGSRQTSVDSASSLRWAQANAGFEADADHTWCVESARVCHSSRWVTPNESLWCSGVTTGWAERSRHSGDLFFTGFWKR